MNRDSPPTIAQLYPSGTLTFLFTDVQGSTRLWEQFPEAMRSMMARHDELIESSVAQHNGKVVRPRGEGDSRFAVFSSAVDAVAAACDIQSVLFHEPWSLPSPLRVRIGVHTGPAELREGDYYGSAVNRCARLRNVAHGGQTLISQTTFNWVKEALPEGVGLRDLGEHRLKDLQQPERIYQLLIPSLPSDFPPIKALESLQTNLPASLTSFVGRELELVEVKQMLASTRLLTILGVGGAGKTRLALQVAAELIDSFVDGVWLIDLASLSNPALITREIADTLGIREEEKRPLVQSLLDSLRTKNSLLILDNCEHLIGGVAQLTEMILLGAPDLRILATSREALRIAGEKVWRIPPLSKPGLDETVPIDRLGRYDAVMLFLDRANSVNPEFTVTRENVSSVVKICVRLDGIPLAIELAAARVRALPVEEIAVRLDDRFRLLVGGTRTAVHRQQTLRALIDWSHDLLSEAERVLLRRLAVFAGGWTLGAAEEVCSNEEIEPGQVLDLLSLLIDKSLVIAESQGGHERYHFLETIRQYARERLDESGEKGAQECRHAEYFLKMAQESYGLLWGPKQGQWLAQLELEHENMRLALEWMVREPSRALMLLSMAGSLWRFWEIRGYFGEGRAWLDRALTANPNAPAGLRAHALRGMGRLARQLGDYTQARTMHEQSLALFREIEDKFGIAREMDALGEIAHQLGDYSQALAMHTESLAIRFEINDKEGMAMSLNQLGILALDRGQYQHAGDLLEESLKLTREMGDKLYTAFSLNNLGFAAYHLSEYTRAIPLIEEALSLYRELNDRIGVSNALLELGNLFKDQGYFRRAISLYDECLVIKEEYGDKRGVARVIVGMAEVAFSQGNYAHAADLSEKSSDLFRELGVKRGLNNALIVRAFVAQYQGQDELVHSLVSESLALSSEMDAPRGIAYSKALYGLADFSQGRLVEARGQFLEALAIFRKVGDRRSVARMLVNLARTAYRQADQVVATNYLEESMSISRELDCRWTLAYSLEIMGLIQRSLGHLDQAGQLIRESLRLSAEQDNQQGILNCLGALAGLAAMTGQPIRAARLFAVADRLRETIGVRMGVDDRREYERYLDSLRDQLTQATFEAAWSEGNALSVEAAIEEAERD